MWEFQSMTQGQTQTQNSKKQIWIFGSGNRIEIYCNFNLRLKVRICCVDLFWEGVNLRLRAKSEPQSAVE
jgi:hypothetical protein